MNDKVLCPLCNQDDLLRVELVLMGRAAILCPECEALWFREQDVGPPTEGSYEVTWFQYGTFMDRSGLPRGQFGKEIKIVGPLTR